MFRMTSDLKMYVVTSLYAVDTVGTEVNKCWLSSSDNFFAKLFVLKRTGVPTLM